MATIKPYDTAAGKRYRVRYRKPDKSQTDKRGFRTKKEAELFLASVTVAKATGDYIDPSLGRITVAHLAPGWLAAKKSVLKPSAYKPLEYAWTGHVEPIWGSRAVQSIAPSEVQAWISELAGRRSPTVVKRAHGVLAGILDVAVDDRRIPRNVARGLALPKKKSGRRIYLTHEQVHAFAIASPHPTLVLLLAYTGLRWSEAIALRVRHVNDLKRRLWIDSNAVLVASVMHEGTPKTGESRSVPYPAFLAVPLAELRAGKGANDLIFDDGGDFMRPPKPGNGWFQVAVDKVQQAEQEAIEAAEERGEKLQLARFPRVTPHDLRHTAASLAVSSGANVKAVQRMLGHSSAAMTLDTYADLFEDDLDEVAERLSAVAILAGVGKVWAKEIA